MTHGGAAASHGSERDGDEAAPHCPEGDPRQNGGDVRGEDGKQHELNVDARTGKVTADRVDDDHGRDEDHGDDERDGHDH